MATESDLFFFGCLRIQYLFISIQIRINWVTRGHRHTTSDLIKNLVKSQWDSTHSAFSFTSQIAPNYYLQMADNKQRHVPLILPANAPLFTEDDDHHHHHHNHGQITIHCERCPVSRTFLKLQAHRQFRGCNSVCRNDSPVMPVEQQQHQRPPHLHQWPQPPPPMPGRVN